MKVLLKLYSTQDHAADNSRIPRNVTEEYLKGEDYKKLIKDKLGIGGLTHKDRRLSSEYSGIIGQDDQVLINDNATHYFTKIFMKGAEDPFVYGEIEFFDPDLFVGKRRENIINLMGLLKSGVKLPVSIVIHALWNNNDVAEKIIRIKGVDFTQNNSFPNAGPIDQTEKNFSAVDCKTFSLTEEEKKQFPDSQSIEKIFSVDGVVMYADGEETETKEEFNSDGYEVGSETETTDESGGGRFGVEGGPESESEQTDTKDEEVTIESIKQDLKESVLEEIKDDLDKSLSDEVKKSDETSEENVEVQPVDKEGEDTITIEREYSVDDIISKYGRNSSQYQVCKNFSGKVPESVLDQLVQDFENNGRKQLVADLSEVDYAILRTLLSEMIQDANEDVLKQVYRVNTPTLVQIFNSIPKDEPERVKLLRIELNKFFRNIPQYAMYSTVNSVRDRMYISRFPRLAAVGRILRIYKQYYVMYGKSLSESNQKLLDNLIIQDLNLLIKKVDKQLYQGRLLTAIYGLNQFGDTNIIHTADQLSKCYRRVMLIKNIMGFIPKVLYVELTDKLNKFYGAVIGYIKDDNIQISAPDLDTLNVV